MKKHLGGSYGVTHIDEGVLRYFVERMGCLSMVDIGCGPGGMVQLAIDKFGLDAYGIDGDTKVRKVTTQILTHDYVIGPFKYGYVDLAWSVEFLEHVEERFIPNIMSTFQDAKYVVCTTNPNKWGHHHVNCQPVEYWIKEFTKYGFEYIPVLTDAVRKLSTMKRDFMRETGMVFINKNKKYV